MDNFFEDNEIVLINKAEIVEIVRCALSKIDPRLMEHGERVGYIAAKICEQSESRSDINLSKLFILCVLHDIGAYKTDEIDDMVRFETEAQFDHSLYGYLFIKNTIHLSEYAEAVLYHHTDYSSKVMKTCPCAAYAQLIYLADRADILMNSGKGDLSAIRAHSGSKFSPEFVDALFRAEEKYGMSKKIADGSYIETVNELISSVEISGFETMDYLKLLVYAMDFRSPYTVTHTADTTIISVETGKLMALSEHELQSLYLGAFLHDIGKIAIPHSILEKPGELTAKEYAAVQKHITEGENILRGVVNDEICDIALRHHEKLDGSGYFRGLTAEQLTLPQRILAVADIMSALTQQRSYKEAYPKDKVIGILRGMRDSGKLCPRVIDTVCENYDTIIGNAKISHDPVKVLYTQLIREHAERRASMYD